MFDHYGFPLNTPIWGNACPNQNGAAVPHAAHHRVPPELRVVLADCSVTWQGERWFIPHSYRPGERVLCSPTRRGVFLRIQDPHKARPDILAERIAPLHNPPRSAHTPCTGPRWGTPTTFPQAHADQADHQPGTRQLPLPAKAPGSKRNHRTDNAHAAPDETASSIGAAYPNPQCIPCRNQCTCKAPCSCPFSRCVYDAFNLAARNSIAY